MKYLSVCSGIESATVAWHSLGWEPVAFSEIEKFPCAVLAHHYPDVPNWGDMTKFKEWPDATIDLLVGGTPCQSFSIAGLRKGLDDPRGDLMLTYLAIAARYRPKWVVWENVPGVLSSNKGRDFGAFIGGLGKIGYGFAYRILDAQYFGVAQRRRRVFVVGCLGDWRSAAAVLFEQDCMQGNSAPSREKRESVAGTIEASLGRSCGAGTPVAALTACGVCTCGADDNQAQAGHLIGMKKSLGPGLPIQDVAGTLNSNNKAAGSATNQDAESGLLIPMAHHSTGVGSWQEGFGTLRAREQDSHESIVCETQYGDEVAGTLTARHDSSPCADRGQNCVAIRTAQTSANGHGLANEVAHTMDQANGQCIAFEPGIAKREGSKSRFSEEISPTLRSNMGDNQPAVAIQARADSENLNNKKQQTYISEPTTLAIRGRKNGQNLEYRTDGTANAILTPNGGRAGIGVGAIHSDMQVRRLTPRECERLMGFEDDYTLIQAYAKGSKKEDREEVARWIMRGDINMTFEQALEYAGHPDGPRYKALGNSKAVPVVKWIGERIDKVEAIKEAA